MGGVRAQLILVLRVIYEHKHKNGSRRPKASGTVGPSIDRYGDINRPSSHSRDMYACAHNSTLLEVIQNHGRKRHDRQTGLFTGDHSK